MIGFVFIATCLPTGKSYIGSHKGTPERWPFYVGTGGKDYLQVRKAHHPKKCAEAWRREVIYVGESYLAEELTALDAHDAVASDQYYNERRIAQKGTCDMAFYQTPEHGEKISKALKGRFLGRPSPNKGKPAHNKGVPMSEESKARIKASWVGRKGKPRSEDVKRRISESLKARRKNGNESAAGQAMTSGSNGGTGVAAHY